MITAILGFACFLIGVATVWVLTESRRGATRIREAEAQAALARAASITAKEQQLGERFAKLEADEARFRQAGISFQNLLDENAMLKQDLRNIEVMYRKLQIDRDKQAEHQKHLDDRAVELGRRYLRDVEKWIGQSLNANNFAACKERLTDVIAWSREIGFPVTAETEAELLAQLRTDFEMEVRAALEREEQARIKARIREEQQREKEIERELQQLDRERAAIQAALDKALADSRNTHSAEVEALKTRLAEAEARNQRAISMAQQTKAGHIYVISNIGSFGENVFKIGMTRRLDPLERIKELSDASVPFPFDIHMMISSTDAPGLEGKLHAAFGDQRLNKVNPRKEFFRTTVEAIRKVAETHEGKIVHIADAEALEYRQSATMNDADQRYIASVYETAEKAVHPNEDD
jgi:hypothetical protein